MLNSDVICKPTRKPGSSRPISPATAALAAGSGCDGASFASSKRIGRMSSRGTGRVRHARNVVSRRHLRAVFGLGDGAGSTGRGNRGTAILFRGRSAEAFTAGTVGCVPLSTPPPGSAAPGLHAEIETSAGAAGANSCTCADIRELRDDPGIGGRLFDASRQERL